MNKPTPISGVSPLLEQALAASKDRRAGSVELWRMSPAEREARMWRGELSFDQLLEWGRLAPREVPRINGEFAFIAWKTPEVAESEHGRVLMAAQRARAEARLAAERGEAVCP